MGLWVMQAASSLESQVLSLNSQVLEEEKKRRRGEEEKRTEAEKEAFHSLFFSFLFSIRTSKLRRDLTCSFNSNNDNNDNNYNNNYNNDNINNYTMHRHIID